ncbi:MAG: hypothetical protein M3Y24_02820 [Acidobacteriota bacterium]|nr:hypothetical protein [Acidobacteriota bacterium]
MKQVFYRNRRALQIENALVRITVTAEGAHVAEILHKPTGVNPLWTPPWPSIEPSAFDALRHSEYGLDADAKLLSGILGHNICLDTFGAPSPEEIAAGIPIHGEAWELPYNVTENTDGFTLDATLPKAELRFERRVRLASESGVVRFTECVENLSATDRPIAWTQHVTLGPPFLERGRTQFRASATRSKVAGPGFNGGLGSQQSDAEFEWPLCPARNGGTHDFRVFTDAAVSGGFTAHLMDPAREQAWFAAWSPETKLVFGYIWRRADFPWLARWEENHLRTQPPWNGEALACGMEFGVSPMVESRREMVARAELFETPTYLWAPARTRLEAHYCAFIGQGDAVPESVEWDGKDSVTFTY